jgi:hypothetical protein
MRVPRGPSGAGPPRVLPEDSILRERHIPQNSASARLCWTY